MRRFLIITTLLAVMLIQLVACASPATTPTVPQSPTQQAPAEGLKTPRPLTPIEEQKAIALAETTSQVAELTRWGVWGKDTQATVVAVRVEGSQITYYERLGPVNPKSSTPGINNYFPAVFYHFYAPMDTGNPADSHRYLMVIVDLPTNRVLEIVSNPGTSGAILPSSPQPNGGKGVLPWIITGLIWAIALGLVGYLVFRPNVFRLKAKLILILSIASALTLLTLFMFFREQFITALWWTLGIMFFIFLLIAIASQGSDRDEDEYDVVGFIFRRRK